MHHEISFMFLNIRWEAQYKIVGLFTHWMCVDFLSKNFKIKCLSNTRVVHGLIDNVDINMGISAISKHNSSQMFLKKLLNIFCLLFVQFKHQ